MKKSNGILVWGIDYDRLANNIGKRLQANHQENIRVVKYEGPLISEKEMKEMSKRAAREPFTFHPDIEAYAKARDNWILQKILSYKKKERKWAVELHSTEWEEYEPKNPEWDFSQIYFSLASHNRNAKMKKLIDKGYREVYKQNFLGNDFGWDKLRQQFPSLVTIELFHYPKYQEAEKGEKIVRSFLDYLSTNY